MDQSSLSEEEQQRFAQALLQELDALYSFAWWLTNRRQQESQDLVQETCVRALRFAHQFQPGTNLKAWLFSILKHEWFRRAGQARREVLPDLGTGTEGVLGRAGVADVELTQAPLREDLDAALCALPEEYRSAILLFDLYGFSLKETAEILAVPDGTVKSRLARGRQMLRGLLVAYSRSRSGG